MSSEVDREQRVVDTLYGRLDQLRDRVAAQLATVRRTRAGSPQNRSERDAFAALYEDRLAQLRSVEDRLVFGRLDLRDGTTRYVGRTGLSDDDHRQLLVDWRAGAAEPFYRATAAAPGDVVRRRHIATRGRRVTGVEDEVLDLDRAGEPGELALSGEGALMAALGQHRTGRMRDIVATIQVEQDRVIRDPLPGVLVVQGGPGTGKTAVALHRAAYLLYTHRDRLARSGILVVGPSPVYLRYIEQVLPSLGETGVVLSTVGQLLPGVDATATEDPCVAALKGDRRMAAVLRRAVAGRQRMPSGPRRLDVDGTRIELQPDDVAAARARARRSRKPHNAAREQFVRDVLDRLAARLAAALRAPLDEDTRPDLLAALREAPDVRREVNLCWMPLRPQRLLADLWSDPGQLVAVAPHLSAEDLALLRRDRGEPWTPADVPLLDEAAELLGEDDAPARAEARLRAAERAAEVRYAQGVLQISGAGGGMVSAEALADRFADPGTFPTVAERAAGDRTWAYGHVVVDEAQELSPMAWRAVLRRCPLRSMTVVGDTAQTAALAGASSWGQVMDRYVPGRWRLAELTINYRTPGDVMAVATAVLAAAGVPAQPPRPARSGHRPVAVRMPAVDVDSVERLVRDELPVLGEGRLAVITPRAGFPRLARDLACRLAPGTMASRTLTAGTAGGSAPAAEALDAPVAVLDVEQAKGLEFDTVVLLEPGAVLSQSPRGANDLYVALTRPTRRLVVLHAGPLPAGMETLDRRAA